MGIMRFPGTILPGGPLVLRPTPSTKVWENKRLCSHPGSYFLSTLMREKESSTYNHLLILSQVTGSEADLGTEGPNGHTDGALDPVLAPWPTSTRASSHPEIVTALPYAHPRRVDGTHPSRGRSTRETLDAQCFRACSWWPHKTTFSMNFLRLCQTGNIKERKWISYPGEKTIQKNGMTHFFHFSNVS